MMRKFALLPVIALAACMESTTTQPLSGDRASASHLIHQKDEVVSMVVTACNGEAVEMSGTVHIKFDFDFNPDGSFKARSSSKYKLSGVGSVTGARYQATQKIEERASADASSSSSSNEISLHLTAQGKIPNSVIRIRERTVIEDGEVKVSRSDITTRCK